MCEVNVLRGWLGFVDHSFVAARINVFLVSQLKNISNGKTHFNYL